MTSSLKKIKLGHQLRFGIFVLLWRAVFTPISLAQPGEQLSFNPPGSTPQHQSGSFGLTAKTFSGLAYGASGSPSSASGFALGVYSSFELSPWSRVGGTVFFYGSGSAKSESSVVYYQNLKGLEINYGSRVSSKLWLLWQLAMEGISAKIKITEPSVIYEAKNLSGPLVTAGMSVDFAQSEQMTTGVGLKLKKLYLPSTTYTPTTSESASKSYDGQNFSLIVLDFTLKWRV